MLVVFVFFLFVVVSESLVVVPSCVDVTDRVLRIRLSIWLLLSSSSSLNESFGIIGSSSSSSIFSFSASSCLCLLFSLFFGECGSSSISDGVSISLINAGAGESRFFCVTIDDVVSSSGVCVLMSGGALT